MRHVQCRGSPGDFRRPHRGKDRILSFISDAAFSVNVTTRSLPKSRGPREKSTLPDLTRSTNTEVLPAPAAQPRRACCFPARVIASSCSLVQSVSPRASPPPRISSQMPPGGGAITRYLLPGNRMSNEHSGP